MSHTIPTTARIALAAGTALGLAACAPMDEPASSEPDAVLASLDTERACFFQRDVNGYSNAPESANGNDRIWIDTGVRERFLVEAFGTCPELDFSQQIGFETRGAISVCTGDQETLLVPSAIPGGTERCPVRVLGRQMRD